MEPILQKTPPPAEPVTWPSTGILVARISGFFSIFVLLVLLVNYFQGEAANPLNNRQLSDLKAQLQKTPADAALKKQIRSIDLELRKKHFQHVAIQNYGAWLLIGGAIVFLSTYKPSTYRKKLPKPQKRSEADYQKEVHQTRMGIIVLGLTVGGTALTLSINSETKLMPSFASGKTNGTPALAEAPGSQSPTKSVAATASFPTTAELAQNWPRFRGPGGSGISAFTNVPITWDSKTGSNILWKIEVPIAGPSSPVIWKDRIFLVGANATQREVYCFDTTGKLLWQKPVDPKRAPAEPPTVMEDSGGYAPSTPCTDGQRVYAIFANGDVAAFDFAGNQVWAKNLGRPDNTYGHASSLEMYQNRLLIQFDQGSSAKENKSKILALDAATGQSVWESDPRPVPNSWATPILINNGQRDLLVTCGNPFVIAHDPTNGKEVWRAKVLGGEVLPSPTYSSGFVYAGIEGEKLSAIPAGGTGDVTTNVAWTVEDGLPDIVSPLCDGEHLFLINSSGTLTCYNAKEGKKLWNKDLERTIKASTSLAGDRVYVLAEDGTGFVVQAANEYKELARSSLGEDVLSTPAFADGRIYIRGKSHLFCIGDQ